MGFLKTLRRLWLNLPLRRKGLLVTTLPVAALTSFSAAFLIAQHQYKGAGQWIRQALEVSSSLQRARILLLDSNDAAKGYILTGEANYLARYRASTARAQESLGQLRPMLTGRPEQLVHVDTLRSLVSEEIRANDAYLTTPRDPSDLTGPENRQWLNRNRLISAKIGAELGAMQTLDRKSLAARTVQLNRALIAANFMGAASIFVGLIGGVIAMLLFATGVVQRVQRLQVDAACLAEGRMPAPRDAASDEIGMAAQALRSTADLLENRNQNLQRRACELAESHAANEQQSRLLQCILDSMGDGVTVADQNGNMILINPAVERLFGIGAVRLGRNGWLDTQRIFHADTVTPYTIEELPLVQAMRGETPGPIELFIRDPQGDGGRWVNIVSRPLRGEKVAIGGGVSVIRDVTLEKRAGENLRQAREEAERANQAKSEFLSRMSHELRTPLNSVLGFAQLLELDPLNPRQRQSVEQILKGGRHLLGLINEVLDLARIESGRLALSTEPIAVHEAVQSAVDLVTSLSVQSGVALKIEDSPDWKQHILADRQRFQQVVLNLLSNAVKYNHAGGRVTINCRATETGYLRLSIQDTGQGVPAGKVSMLFTPFERLGAEQSGIEGTGIGLALSKRLVEAMGGSIGVETAAGFGSTFWVELPLCAGPLETFDRLRGDDAFDLHYEPAGKIATLLYVEDNLANNLLMERILENRPEVRLISAMQGRLGLDLARQHSPDLILLDLHLPDMNGMEVLRGLRGDPRTSSIPVAMISADATPGQVDRLLAAGAQEYFTKPLDVKRLLQFVDATLGAAV